MQVYGLCNPLHCYMEADILATIKDVAALAGVSVATVSRVINGDDVVLSSTKEQVLKAISALNYSPNLLGRNLRRLETKKILVMLNTISNQFYSRVVKGIEECARNDGYTVMVCMTHGDKELEKEFFTLLRTRLVDGAVFLTAETNGDILTGMLNGLPVVQACEPKTDFLTPSVSIDNEKAAYEAVLYLLKNGHKKIAYFGATGIYSSSTLREKGYKKAILENCGELNESLILSEGFSFNSGIRAAKKLMQNDKANFPTAVFCVSDSCAAGAIKTFFEHGIKTPQDISVMGFDDTQISQIYIPSITTTRQPQYELGYTAMNLLLERIKANSKAELKANIFKNIILPHEIVIRDSVRKIG